MPILSMQPMELDQGYLADGSEEEAAGQVVRHVNPVPALRQLSIAATARQLPEMFKNSTQAHRIASLPEELRQELWYCHMFGENERVAERNPAILWLLSQCPVLQRRERYQDTVFATQVRECNNMCVRVHSGKIVEVVTVPLNQQVFVHASEASIKCAQFSPDGKHLYLIAADRSVGIFDTLTWNQVHQTELHCRMRSPGFVKLTLDTTAVVCGSINTLLMHDTLTGAPLCNLVRGSQEMIMHVELSANGNNVFVFYEDAVHVHDENMPALLDAFNPVDMQVQRFDISAVNILLSELPGLSLEQLLVLQIVLGIADGKEPMDLIAQPWLHVQYDALPENIRAIIERAVPGIKNHIPGFDTPMPESESDRKRRKVALEGANRI